MNDTCATHRSRVPRRSFGRNKRRSDDIGRRERTRPGFYFMFCVWQSSVRGCRFSVMFVYLVIKRFKCSPVPASFFPYLLSSLQKRCRDLHFYNSINVSHRLMKSCTHTSGLHAHLNSWAKYRKVQYRRVSISWKWKKTSGQVQRQHMWVFGQAQVILSGFFFLCVMLFWPQRP